MKLLLNYLLAFSGGVFLAIQASFNTQLGALIKQPVLAVVTSSVISAMVGALFILVFSKNSLQLINVQQVPLYLWFVGGLFSMAGISLYFYTIPKLGISKMISMGLCGQLVFSALAGKYGWLGLPKEPFTTTHFFGAFAMLVGIVLMNSK